MYGVSANNLYAISLATGTVKTGFPVALSAIPLGSPTVTNFDGQSGHEIAVNLSSGGRVVTTELGNQVLSLGFNSLDASLIDSAEPEEYGVFTVFDKISTGLFGGVKNLIVSMFSRAEFAPKTNHLVPPVTTLPNGATVYEDGSSGGTAGWSIFDNDPTGTVINNIFEDELHGNVIEFVGGNLNNGYELRNADGSFWQNSSQFTIQWDYNFSTQAYFYVDLNTNKGRQQMVYWPQGDPSWASTAYFFQVVNVQDKWTTVTRDLQADLASKDPDRIITSINRFMVRGSGRVDNIMIFGSQTVANITGSVVDESGLPIAGALLTLQPSGISTVTDISGNYNFSAIPSGAYQIFVRANGVAFANSQLNIDTTAGDVIQDISGQKVNFELLEDAEDGDTANWTIIDNDPAVASITNVYENSERGNVISLSGAPGKANAYKYAPPTLPLISTSKKIIEWDMNQSDFGALSVTLNTSLGKKFITYQPIEIQNTDDIMINISVGAVYNSWRTITRDLEADLNSVFPGASINSISELSYRGNVKIDNITLYEAPSAGSVTGTITGGATPLVGATVQIWPTNKTATTDLDGHYVISNVPKGKYDVSVTAPNYFFLNSEIDTNISLVLDVVGQAVDTTVYENAEDSLTDRWYITDVDPQGASVSIINEGGAYGNVIQLATDSFQDAFRLGTASSQQLNSTQLLASWDIMTEANSTVMFAVGTNNGWKLLSYTYSDAPTTPTGNINIPLYNRMFEWRHVTRDLQADVDLKQPGTVINIIYGVVFKGKSKVDNFELHKAQ
ncbi:hypothetical protein CO173_04370 [Candidatus Uhrbacteria bacterium CG_4_9_14_3_um_filter_41_35]|uniref:Uncharacterized protein n=1 Tax=Candidatus Uhrbacteria bacterium CG_4_9_14_3_um_filter_41_35 TaxID=1975034 RepID=A0A2M7XD97_9BACT|nr:MAG: hypothetical protein CO173_04370 [Candidatus Uhrbacteria bacterium CG_4_9_14_3_um_filter_41_35]